jgi:ALIX V-shaped domain binding to HIV
MTEDEEYQRAYARYDKWDRAPSEQANTTITAEAKKYHQLLDQAAKSDALVRHRWEEWEEQIRLLAQDEVHGCVVLICLLLNGAPSPRLQLRALSRRRRDVRR